jgi:signal transduction histidine kinase
MKIKYKAASIMALFGTILVFLLSVGYNILNRQIVIEKELENIKYFSEEAALHLDSHLNEKIKIASTLSSSPLIKDALLKSNAQFAALSDLKRKNEIDKLNLQWKNTANINSPFLQSYLTNPVAEYLKQQQTIIPDEYGEIFLTNRYGVMIATTGKLTTLAHAQKYWWQATYHDGEGKIFLDDRGFDNSVKGYVLGVVIPIKDKNEIIGILKCNVNTMGSLTDIVQEFSSRQQGNMSVVRTGGLIVAEQGKIPLSTQVDKNIIMSLQQRKSGTKVIEKNKERKLIAFAPVSMTMGSKQFGFGGSKESIDHLKGNKGEGWYIVISLDEIQALATATKTTREIIIIGLIFTLLTAVVALLFGNWLAKPIVKLATTARIIGDGHLDTRIPINSNDEIGSLAKSLNAMASNLYETMASRDELETEVKQRKKAETERERVITEHQQLEEQIRHSEKMTAIGQLAGGIAHDFNNQLTSVLGFAEMLENRLEDKELCKFASHIKNAAKRSAELTGQLLNFSRKGKNLSESVNIHKVIAEVISILEHSIDKRIKLHQILNASPATTIGDPTQLQNAILNIVLNARDAMPEGGDITFETDVSELDEIFCKANADELLLGSYLELSIKDNGCGMDTETQKHIFEPFYTKKKVGEGTGMGLASVYGTIQNHNGSIKVYSEVGHGTTFRLYLPSSEDLSSEQEAIVKSSPITGNARILLVDDEPAVRAIATEMLKELGYKVTVCTNGKEAIEHYKKSWKDIDLVLLDMVMPKLGGRDVFAAMRKINPDIRAILSSGYSISGDVQTILDEGVMAFVGKPYELAKLSGTVARILQGE